MSFICIFHSIIRPSIVQVSLNVLEFVNFHPTFMDHVTINDTQDPNMLPIIIKGVNKDA